MTDVQSDAELLAHASIADAVSPVANRPPTSADLSGWPLDPSERRDFYHRTRVFPTEVARWRKDVVARALRGALRFPAVGKDADEESVRALLDDGISFVREVARILALTHSAAAAHSTRDATAPGLSADALRVWSRLRPFRELGIDLKSASRTTAEDTFEDLSPPILRTSLRRLLNVHGATVCVEDRPQCERCEVQNFCGTFRESEVARVTASNAPTAVDLFTGAGGLSEGFTRAGFRVLAALDLDPMALRTYRLNHPTVPDSLVLERDIREMKPGSIRRLINRQSVDVLIGAPPCQGFSQAGFRSKKTHLGYSVSKDERNYLFEYVVAAALELKPRLVVMENVPGMQSARKENLSFLESAARMLADKGGYRTAIWRLNASAFGVPQDRIRYFLVGSSVDILPAAPIEEYQDMHRPNFDLDALPPVTLDEAIFDLPVRAADEGTAVDPYVPAVPTSDRRARRYLTRAGLLRPSGIVYNHTVRYHNERDLELYALLRPGEDSVHALERYQRDDLMRYRRDVFDDKYARLRGDRPCKTIVSHLAKDGNAYIHPTQVRSISFREAARVQSFHDGFAFCGSPSDQWVQLGNAVPPALAEIIAKALKKVLGRGTGR